MKKNMIKLGEWILIAMIAAIAFIVNISVHQDYNRVRYGIALQRNKTLDTVECYYYRRLFINQDAVPQNGDHILVDEELNAGHLWTYNHSYNKPYIQIYKKMPLGYQLKPTDTTTYKGYQSYKWGSSDDEYTLEEVIAHNQQNPLDKISLKPSRIKKRLYGIVIATHYQKEHGDLWLKSTKQQFMWKYTDFTVAGFLIAIISLLWFYGGRIYKFITMLLKKCKVWYNTYGLKMKLTKKNEKNGN